MEAVAGVRPEVEEAIRVSLQTCLTETDLHLGPCTVVRTSSNSAAQHTVLALVHHRVMFLSEYRWHL